jgi:sodium pump decarboxylase, gamma subunit
MALCACGKKVPEDISSMLTSDAESFLHELYKMDEGELIQESMNAQQYGQPVIAEGINSFITTKESVGDLVSIDKIATAYEDGNYVVKLYYSGTLGKAEFAIGISEETNNLVAVSFLPRYSLAEKMEKAALNTILGMGTVFIILIFISFLISLFKYISVFENKLKSKKNAKPVVNDIVENSEPQNTENHESLVDDLELIAVITAAIAEFSNTDASNLIVRSIKRVKR